MPSYTLITHQRNGRTESVVKADITAPNDEVVKQMVPGILEQVSAVKEFTLRRGKTTIMYSKIN